MPSRRQFLRLAVVGSVALPGCTGNGGDGDGNGGGENTTPTSTPNRTETPTQSDTPTPTPTATETPTPTATPQSAQEAYPDYEWNKLNDAEPVATNTITMSGYEFVPLVAAVQPGTEITVTNEDAARHTFTVPMLGISKTVAGGDSVSLTVDRTGTFDYVCAFHPPGMLGRLVVTTNPPTPASTPTPSPTPTD